MPGPYLPGAGTGRLRPGMHQLAWLAMFALSAFIDIVDGRLRVTNQVSDKGPISMGWLTGMGADALPGTAHLYWTRGFLAFPMRSG